MTYADANVATAALKMKVQFISRSDSTESMTTHACLMRCGLEAFLPATQFSSALEKSRCWKRTKWGSWEQWDRELLRSRPLLDSLDSLCSEDGASFIHLPALWPVTNEVRPKKAGERVRSAVSTVRSSEWNTGQEILDGSAPASRDHLVHRTLLFASSHLLLSIPARFTSTSRVLSFSRQSQTFPDYV
jgi:hypothetical protein